jgi:hypothetical protein
LLKNGACKSASDIARRIVRRESMDKMGCRVSIVFSQSMRQVGHPFPRQRFQFSRRQKEINAKANVA